MTILQERNQNKLSYLAEIQASIEQLKQQIANLTHHWKEILTPIDELLTFACGVYEDINVLDDMKNDLERLVNKAKDNFEENKQKPNKFLDEAKKIEIDSSPKLEAKTEIKDEPKTIEVVAKITETMPDENDNETILVSEQIERIIEPLNEEIMSQLKKTFDISNKISRLSTIATALSKKSLTYYRLQKIIDNLKGQQLLLTGI